MQWPVGLIINAKQLPELLKTLINYPAAKSGVSLKVLNTPRGGMAPYATQLNDNSIKVAIGFTGRRSLNYGYFLSNSSAI